MQAQETSVVNAAYFDNLTAQVNAFQGVNACAELQALANSAMASLQAEVTAIEAQIAALLPLVTAPTSLSSVISWITSFQAPFIKPYANYVSQLSQTLTAIANLTAAIEAAAARLVTCSVTVPTITH